jgi:hypothetical protein
MKMLGGSAFLPIAASLLFMCEPGYGPAQQAGISAPASERTDPGVRIELQPNDERGPHFTFTNLDEKALTACYLEISSSSDDHDHTGMDWDALIGRRSPIEQGKSISMALPHRVGGLFPDKVEVWAAVWVDGSTFGRPELIKLILTNRRMRVQEFQQAIALLQAGLEQNWTGTQYLAALEDPQKKAVFGEAAYEISSTIKATADLDSNVPAPQGSLRRILESFTRQLDALRESKPDLSNASNFH